VSGSVRIKICGITTVEDARLAVGAGADLIGLNFVPGSPRQLEIARAVEIAEAVAGEVERVALFRDEDPAEIERVLRRVEVERVQLHGDESPEEVEAMDLPVIKALRGADREAAERYPGTILLLDHPTAGGGRGQSWPWSDAMPLLADGYDLILAGGLAPDNVGQALAELGDLLPWGVDVATGVEGEGYRKDPDKIAAFIRAVREAEDAGAESEEGSEEGS
jgi:phosphoribosylanthranilate isomerase